MLRFGPVALAIITLSACSGDAITSPASSGASDTTIPQMFGHWDFSMGPFDSGTAAHGWDCGGNGTLVVSEQSASVFTGWISANVEHGTAAILDCNELVNGDVVSDAFTFLGDFGFDQNGNPFVVDTGTVLGLDVTFSLRDRANQICTWRGKLSEDGSTITGTARCVMPFEQTLEAPLLAVRREVCPVGTTASRARPAET